MGRVARHRDETGIADAQSLRSRIDQRARQRPHAQLRRQCIDQGVAAGVGQPPQRAALLDPGHHRGDLAVGKRRTWRRDQQHVGIGRDRRLLGQVDRQRAHALLGQRGTEAAEVVVGLAVDAALAVAGQHRKQAFARLHQARQRAGQGALVELGQALGAAGVVDLELAVDGDAAFAHGTRIGIGIDEAQAQVGLELAVTADEGAEGLAQLRILARVGHDLDRPLELAQHLHALRRQTRARAVAEVHAPGPAQR